MWAFFVMLLVKPNWNMMVSGWNDDTVGRWLAAAVRLLLLIYDNSRLKWHKNILTPVGTTLAVVRQRLPLTRAQSFFFWKMTEGEITKICCLLLSLLPSRLRRATFLVRWRPYSTSIFIWYLICNWLRTGASPVPTDCVNILISYQPKIIIFQQQSNGGSKPPPYTVKLNFRIYIRLLSNLIIYATVGATCGRLQIHNKKNGRTQFAPTI